MSFQDEVLAGLSQPQKAIPCTWLYDARGSELFERITVLPEYYPTRTETRLLHGVAEETAARLHRGAGLTLVELGSGASVKTRLLLRAMPALAAYVPIDICAEFLHETAARIAQDFPRLLVRPLAADFTQPFELPELPAQDGAASPRLGFFPGSTIGNFAPDAAATLLRRLADALGPGAELLIGVDTTQDPARLVSAYDDAAGVTAEFDLNLLDRVNRELDGDFDRAAFRHEARWNAEAGRIEMHLVSRRAQRARVLGHAFEFAEGESIHTENAYKYTPEAFTRLTESAGWGMARCWSDPEGAGFKVFLMRSPRAV